MPVGHYAPRFDCVENKVLASSFSNSIPYLSHAEKLNLIKLAKLNNIDKDGLTTDENILLFREPPARPDPF